MTSAPADLPKSAVSWRGASRLISTRYPPIGLFDRVVSPDDLDAILELEAWTNDRVSAELGMLTLLPRDEWVTGQPMASVVMAAYCHPRPGGARFSTSERGAWYAGRTIETALAESVYHRSRELAEVGHFETRMQMRLYRSDFRAVFHDIRGARRRHAALYDADSYAASQRTAIELLESGSNGIVYDSVRHPGGERLACFRPRLVRNIRVAAHYEYVWDGMPEPRVRRIG